MNQYSLDKRKFQETTKSLIKVIEEELNMYSYEDQPNTPEYDALDDLLSALVGYNDALME